MLAELPAHVSAPDPSIYWSDNYVVLDFETTTELKGSALAEGNRIILACWDSPAYKGEQPGRKENGRAVSSAGSTMRHHFGSEYDLGDLTSAIQAADFVVAHNAKFELGWLKRCGVDLRTVLIFDTLTAEYVLGGNRFTLNQLGLNACLARHGLPSKLDTVGLMIKAGVPTPDIPEAWLLRYCIRDVEASGELFLRQRELLRREGLEAVNYQRCLVTPCLADIEFNGVQLDEQEVLSYEASQEIEYERLTRELQELCNGASPSSAPQMRKYVYEDLGFTIPRDFRGRPYLTPGEEPSVAAPIMAKLVARTEKQRVFLALRGEWLQSHTYLTKYLRKFGDCVRQDGGRLRASFNQCVTKTHRFSSSGLRHKVQFQNFNRKFKPMFKARYDGWLVGEADGAQLEFRIAAHLGRDKVALADIISGADIHAYTASIIGCSRQDAKSHTFKPLYGGSSGSPTEKLYYEAFKSKYHGIASTQRQWTQQVLRDKQLTTEWGLKYYWPDTRMTKSGYIINTTSIYNYPVQAFATAEIIPCALVAAWHRMKGMESFMVNTVHDSIIAELHPEEVADWHDVAKQCLIVDSYNLIYQLYGVKLTVPLGAGVTVGERWADETAKEGEIVYTAEDSLWRPAAEKEGML